MTACPACGGELFGWLQIPAIGDDAEVLLKRCESCGLGVRADASLERPETDRQPGDAAALLLGDARRVPGERAELRVPNRQSVQALLGGRYWAALQPERRLYATPASLRALAAAAQARIEVLTTPRRGRGQSWMWQTILNGLTFNPNFAQAVVSGRLHPAGLPGRLRFGVDAVVTSLAAIPVALISGPLELLAALTGRGGELVATIDLGRRAG